MVSVSFIAAVSLVTLTITGVVVFAFSVSEMPSITLARLLLAELTATPSIVSAAFAAGWVCAAALTPEDGSNARASSAPPAPAVRLVRNALAAPVAAERSTSRTPFASVRMLAVTPAPVH